MHAFAPYLDALGGQSREMADLVAQWVAIRSGTHDIEGLSRMAEALKGPFAVLGGKLRRSTSRPIATSIPWDIRWTCPSARPSGSASGPGRDPHLGRNAVSALAEFVVDLDRFGRTQPGMAVNVGKLEGGGPVNRVPDSRCL